MQKEKQLKSCGKKSLSSREVVARDLPHPMPLSLLNRKQQPYFMREAEDPGQKISGMTPNFMGFTLIELLVVVLIIGILAAVALPQYQVAVDKTRAKTALLIMRHIRDAEELYKLANGNYTMDFTELNLDLPVKSINTNKNTVTLTDGKSFSLDSEGTYPHITAWWSWKTSQLYWAINADVLLCYPYGGERGKRLCKSLGCADADGQYCSFTAAMH